MRPIAAIALLLLTASNALAVRVDVDNQTPFKVKIRCIAPGNVDVSKEFDENIDPGQSKGRSNFQPGLRVIAAWSQDRTKCAAIPVDITDGTKLVLSFDQTTGEISFAQPCSECAKGSSQQYRHGKKK